MSKSRYETAEETIQEIMATENIDAKIEEMKKYLESELEIQAKDKDEYRKLLLEENKKRAGLGKKLNLYENYKKNEKQILNIRKYQIALQDKLEKLEKELKDIKKIEDDEKKFTKQISGEEQKIESELQKILADMQSVETDLKNPNLSDEDRKQLEEKRNDLQTKRRENNDKFIELQERMNHKIKIKHREKADVEKEIKSTEIQISKCNMIWTSLMKGKEWKDINAILQSGNFVAKKGTITKIKNLHEAESERDIFTEIDQNVNNQANMQFGGQEVNPTGANATGRDDGNEQDDSNGGNNGNRALIERKTFAERHPRLAKIPFLAKIADRISEKRAKGVQSQGAGVQGQGIGTSTQGMQQSEEPPIEEPGTVTRRQQKMEFNKALKRVSNELENGNSAWEEVAEKGFETVAQEHLQAKRDAAKQQAAEDLANTYGGQYEHQDGVDR